MSGQAVNPINADPATSQIEGFDTRLVPLVAALVLFGVGVALFICCLNCRRVRRMQRFLEEHPNALTLLREAQEGGPIPPMKTVALEVDLEIGESFVDWARVMPLSAEKNQDETPLTPPSKSMFKKSTPKEETEDEYVRITVLVALPSASGRRNPNVVLDACLADAEGTPLHTPHFQQELCGVNTTAFGILEKKIIG